MKTFTLFDNIIAIVSIYSNIKVETASAETPRIEREDTVRNVKALRFGKFVAERRSGGSVTIEPRKGARRTSSGITDLRGDYGAAVFSVRGVPGGIYRITLPDSVSDDDGKARISDLTSFPAEKLTLGRDGRGEFSVGGTLHLQPDYRGNITTGFTVSIERMLE